MKKILSFFILALVVLGTTLTAQACSVIEGWPGSPKEIIARADGAFIGTVTSTIQDKSAFGDYRITFAVNDTYKGAFATTVTVKAPGSSAACGYDDGYGQFATGSVWVIYASGNATDGYTTNGITGNTKHESVAAAQKALAAAGIEKPEPIMCTMQYAPVCGTSPSGEVKTYGNSCMLGADKATVLYEGECTTSVVSPYTRLLKDGIRGDDVVKMQSTLAAKGYTLGPVDGIFGPATRGAVMRFQADQRLAIDGMVGPMTHAKIFTK